LIKYKGLSRVFLLLIERIREDVVVEVELEGRVNVERREKKINMRIRID
jgi:hypothetical protein